MTGSTALRAGPPPAAALRPRALLLVAMLLAAVNLRTAVTSVGPVLDELQTGIGLSSAGAGVLTTLPVLSFALLGSLTPRLARRFGERRVLCGALVLMAVGLLARAAVTTAVPFLLLSVLALAGGAMGNVLLPVLVKRHFPDRIGQVTAAYTTMLAVGTTSAAAITVPVASVRGGVDWRIGLGCWAVPAALGALIWLALARRDRALPADERPALPAVHRSRTAWSLAVFFGAQSMQAYVAFGWFALFFREQAGVSAAHAGLLVAAIAALAVPISAAVPAVAARHPDQRALIGVLLVCYAVAYTGMLVAPRSGAWAWVVLAGIAGGTFPLTLTMIGLRTRTAEATSSLSAFVQSTGYVLAGGGPLLVGVLHGATDGWGWPFALIFADLAVLAVAGWFAGQPRYVEDDLRQPA